jgi:cytochrome c peroxidase
VTGIATSEGAATAPRLTPTARVLFATAIAICLAGAVHAGSKQVIPFEWDLPLGFPVPSVPADNPMSYEKVELGRMLFYDTRMSGNQTFACASCHQQSLAFTDGLARAEGSTGVVHPRGSMALVNVAYAPTLTWNNNVLERLEEQAMVPMFGVSPVELGLAGREEELLARFAAAPIYRRMFAEAFSEEPDPISVASIVDALASFQRTLMSGTSPYDRWLFGDDGALTESAIRGLPLVLDQMQKTECGHCHGGFNFTGSRTETGEVFLEKPFLNTGLYNLRCSDFDLPEVSDTGTGCYPPSNVGLFEVSSFKEDMGKFKPPTLRNICVTAPYMHDGSIDTLDGVLDHYAAGGRTIESGPHAGIGSLNPLKGDSLPGFTLTDGERADIKEFLCSLTDEEFLTDPSIADPFVPPPCHGDCNFDGVVAMNELIRQVNINIDTGTLASCLAADADRSGTVEIHEVLRSVNRSLNGCTSR